MRISRIIPEKGRSERRNRLTGKGLAKKKKGKNSSLCQKNLPSALPPPELSLRKYIRKEKISSCFPPHTHTSHTPPPPWQFIPLWRLEVVLLSPPPQTRKCSLTTHTSRSWPSLVYPQLHISPLIAYTKRTRPFTNPSPHFVQGPPWSHLVHQALEGGGLILETAVDYADIFLLPL